MLPKKINIVFKMKLKNIIKLADFFTIGNFACGMLSIVFVIEKMFAISAGLIILAVIFDFLDGKVARLTKSQNEFGKELDSLSDVLSFGVAPAFLGYGLGLQSPLAIIILIYFAVCGMLRLARFNISNTKGFEGVPITFNGILFPLLFFIFQSFNNYFLIIYGIMGILMISTLKIKKF